MVTIVAIAVLLLLLVILGFHDKAKPVPYDQNHLAALEALSKGKDRKDVESGCTSCHNLPSLPFPEKHPPKEQCLICHKVSKGGAYEKGR